jgi:thymidylate synthase (FAD)
MKIAKQKVEYVNHMGSDLSIVNAARVSFHKVATKFENKDAKLIKYLADHNHWTPFAHTCVSLRIKCPIFVARQLGKHQVGLVWNEVSRRYVDEEPEFYFPSAWRGKPVNAKQGSSGILDKVVQEQISHSFDIYLNIASEMYNDLLEDGVAPEQARMVLPQNMMTEFIWTGSLVAFARVCKLRLDSHTQQETQEIAKEISTILQSLYPVGMEALMGETNDN